MALRAHQAAIDIDATQRKAAKEAIKDQFASSPSKIVAFTPSDNLEKSVSAHTIDKKAEVQEVCVGQHEHDGDPSGEIISAAFSDGQDGSFLIFLHRYWLGK